MAAKSLGRVPVGGSNFALALGAGVAEGMYEGEKFKEERRKFDESLAENKQQFDRSLSEDARKFDLSLIENKRQYDLTQAFSRMALDEAARQKRLTREHEALLKTQELDVDFKKAMEGEMTRRMGDRLVYKADVYRTKSQKEVAREQLSMQKNEALRNPEKRMEFARTYYDQFGPNPNQWTKEQWGIAIQSGREYFFGQGSTTGAKDMDQATPAMIEALDNEVRAMIMAYPQVEKRVREDYATRVGETTTAEAGARSPYELLYAAATTGKSSPAMKTSASGVGVEGGWSYDEMIDVQNVNPATGVPSLSDDFYRGLSPGQSDALYQIDAMIEEAAFKPRIAPGMSSVIYEDALGASADRIEGEVNKILMSDEFTKSAHPSTVEALREYYSGVISSSLNTYDSRALGVAPKHLVEGAEEESP